MRSWNTAIEMGIAFLGLHPTNETGAKGYFQKEGVKEALFLDWD